MTKRTRWGLFLALLALGLAGVLCAQAGQNQPHRRTIQTMGTLARTTLYASDQTAQAVEQAIDQVYREVLAIANPYDKTSELSRLNAQAGQQPFACSEAMWKILQEARRAYMLSDGAFDISVRPLMELWGFYRKAGKIPTSEAIAAARQKVGLNKIKFDSTHRTVFFTVPGMALDLGGLAKGYALDRAAQVARQAGITAGVIDLGGNLRLLAQPPQGHSSYRIGIRKPDAGGNIMPQVLELPGELAISTSGDYERFVILEGQKFGHIIDPATGIPPVGKFSATSIYPEAMRGDWISTAVYLRGTALAAKLQKVFPNLQIILVPKSK